jgi:SET domain-containing protein
MGVAGTDDLTLVTTKSIGNGVVIGQYVGELSMETASTRDREENEGYHLLMHRDDMHKRTERVCVNALTGGSKMRFLNHACNPNTIFLEMASGSDRYVVVVTKRRVRANEELTVYYGNELWFHCHCAGCRATELPQ